MTGLASPDPRGCRQSGRASCRTATSATAGRWRALTAGTRPMLAQPVSTLGPGSTSSCSSTCGNRGLTFWNESKPNKIGFNSSTRSLASMFGVATR